MATPVTAIDIADETENPLGATKAAPKNRVAKGAGKATGTTPKAEKEPKAKKEKVAKPKKEPKPKKEKGPAYPFESKRSIIAKIAADDKYVVKSFKLLSERNAFMASHRKKAEEASTAKDVAAMRTLLGSYGRKLAEIAREEAVKADPKLLELEKLFCSPKK